MESIATRPKWSANFVRRTGCSVWVEEEINVSEPWLRGTLTELPVVQRAVLHSLEMAEEDLTRWCAPLSEQEIHARPFQLPSVAFQLRHIARSLDRFCCYAQGIPLNAEQLAALAAEMEPVGSNASIFEEFKASLALTRERLNVIIRQPLETPVAIGRKRLPTTLAGLLVHAAEHTQRHVGQAITTAKVIQAGAAKPSAAPNP